VAHHTCCLWAPQPLARCGHGRVSSGRWAHHGAGSAPDAWVACPHGGPTGEPRVRCMGLAAVATLGGRNQLMVLELS
jgi:hypothetical protein